MSKPTHPSYGTSSPDSGVQALLRELAQTQRKSLMATRLALFLCALAITAMAAAVPYTLRTMRRVNTSLEKLDTMTASVETMTAQVGAAAEQMSATLSLVDTAAVGGADLGEAVSSFTDAMDKLNEVDFDRLNQAIDDFADVVEPMRQFSGLFSRQG